VAVVAEEVAAAVPVSVSEPEVAAEVAAVEEVAVVALVPRSSSKPTHHKVEQYQAR
jgi:hypothetical protein